MTSSRFHAVAAALLLAACTKSGDTGPQGPQGPQGIQGTQGDPGIAGTSVTAVQLAPGTSLDCPDGGSEFTSASGITRACNGAKGAKGDPGVDGSAGPRLVLKTAAGELIGPAYPLPVTSNDSTDIAAYHLAAGRLIHLSRATGRAVVKAQIYYADTWCSGGGWMTSHPGTIVEGEFTQRLFAATSLTSESFYSRAQFTTGGCIAPTLSGSGYPMVEVVDARYPYAAPLQLAYE